MKKIILIFAILFCMLSVFSQTSIDRKFNSTPYSNAIETINFTVLDINFDNNLVAFKHVFDPITIYDSDGEIYEQAYNCGYTGMEKNPLAGVVLGVYDLSTQEYLKTFTIYNVAFDESECYDYDLSSKKLDSAKQFFAEHNLDITQKPKPTKLVVEDNAFVFNKIKFHYTNERFTNDEYTEMTTICKLFANDKLLYTINQQDFYYMASGGRIDYKKVYQKNGKFVFLNLFYHTNAMAGDTDHKTYHFSPVYKLSDF